MHFNKIFKKKYIFFLNHQLFELLNHRKFIYFSYGQIFFRSIVDRVKMCTNNEKNKFIYFILHKRRLNKQNKIFLFKIEEKKCIHSKKKQRKFQFGIFSLTLF